MNKDKSNNCNSSYGYTLLEVLIVVLMVGILSAIAAPSWLGFLEKRHLKTAQEQIQRATSEAISRAKKDKLLWQVSFRESNNRLQYMIHPGSIIPPNAIWQSFTEHIQIDKASTTFYLDSKSKIWRVQYNYQGNTNGRLGKITLRLSSGSKARRCVLASTLIGNTRLAGDKDCGN